MYTVKGKPWEYKGAVNVENCSTASEVIKSSGLDFKVEKCKLSARIPVNPEDFNNVCDNKPDGSFFKGSDLFVDTPNAFGTYRKDRSIPLGIVKSRYEVVQNSDAFKFFDDAIGKNKAIWQTAGYFGYGERIFVSAKLPNEIRVNGDPVENYLVFTNSHDGTSGIKILFTPIRVVCQNTLNAAIKTSECYVTFRHTQSVHENIDRAKEILGITNIKVKETQQILDAIFSVKLDDDGVYNYIAHTFLTADEINSISSLDKKNGLKRVFNRERQFLEDVKISTRKANMLHDTLMYYFGGPGQREIQGTAYGAYNAVTGYFSNIANLESTKRMDSLLYGNANNVTAKALDLAMAYY